MRELEFEDERGYKYKSLLREEDPDDMAEEGIIQGPPDLNRLDWSQIKKELHNRLFELGMFTYRDLQHNQNLRAVIVSVLKKHIIALYKELEKHD